MPWKTRPSTSQGGTRSRRASGGGGKFSPGVGRTRRIRQAEAPTYSNGRNRRMNNMLERHYGKFAAETKESFERDTAL